MRASCSSPRRRSAALALAAATLGAAACASLPDPVTGAWRLVEIDGSPPVADGALSMLPDGTFTMRPGCNNGSGTYAVAGNRLTTDSLALTMMACGDLANAQERTFVAVLDGDPRFEIDIAAGRLTLVAADSTLVFVRR